VPEPDLCSRCENILLPGMLNRFRSTQDEVRFQQQLDRLNRTRPLTTAVAVAYDANQQAITVTLPAAHARHSASGHIHFYRPSDASLDRDVPLAVSADGVQRVETNGLLPCSLVYAACAGAIASGGLFSGVEHMLAFGLGTLPMMLGLSLVGRKLQLAIGAKF